MDPMQVNRLKQKQRESLHLCEQKIERWEKFKNDYEVLTQQLESLPNALSYDITVPFGPNAFTMGKLVHTNEVMVLLGDNWFAEVSGKQAAEIANRRILQCNKMLEDLAKEKKQFEDWLNYIDEVCNQDLVEIVEEYNEEKEKEWRVQHSKNVKAYRQRLSKETKHNLKEETPDNDDYLVKAETLDDYLSKLDNLELMETPEDREFSESEAYPQQLSKEAKHSLKEENSDIGSDDDYLARAETLDDYFGKFENLELMETPEDGELSKSEENDQDEASSSKDLSESEGMENDASPLNELTITERSNIEASSFKVPSKSEVYDNDASEEKNSKPSLKLNINYSNDQSSVHETESGDDEDGSKSDDVNANLENCGSGSNGKHVRWQDLSKQSIKKITFKHSRCKHHNNSKHHVKRQDSSESDEPQPLIQSPSDIYKHFGSFFQTSSPKSILKVKNSPSTPDGNETFFPADDLVPNDSSPDVKSESIVNAFTGKVYERSSPIHIPEKKSSSRPSSQFKNARKNRRR